MGPFDSPENKGGMPPTLEEGMALQEILAAIAAQFREALATFSDETQFTQFEDELVVRRLESVESDLWRAYRIARDVVREMEKVPDQENGALRDAFRNVAVCAVDAIEAIQACRWTIMERNADADSVDSLLARLKRH